MIELPSVLRSNEKNFIEPMLLVLFRIFEAGCLSHIKKSECDADCIVATNAAHTKSSAKNTSACCTLEQSNENTCILKFLHEIPREFAALICFSKLT